MWRLGSVACLTIAVACSGPSPSEPPPAAAPQPAAPAPASPGTPAATAQPSTGSSTPQASLAPAPTPVAAPAPAATPAPSAVPQPTFREVTIPAGTQIVVVLRTAVASDQSKVEDPVEGRVLKPVVADGVEAIPAEASVVGNVTEAQQSGRVKGRARVAIRFDRLTAGGERYDITTSPIAREAEATKGEDAKKIGIGAGAGAAVGAIVGGKKGALVGGAVGAGAGTGVVAATRGKEVRLARGTRVTIRLREPLTIRVKVKN